MFFLILFFNFQLFCNAEKNPHLLQLEKLNNKSNIVEYKYDQIIQTKNETAVVISENNEDKSSTEEEISEEESGHEEEPESTTFFDKVKKNFFSFFSLESDLPEPYTMVGKYFGFYVAGIIPSEYKGTARETVFGQSSADLFRLQGSYKFMPSLSLIFGDDLIGPLNYGIELNYIPLQFTTSRIDQLTSGSNFNLNSNTLSFDIFLLYINAFYEFNLFTTRLRGYIGGGAGIGYAIPRNSSLFNANFIFPSFQIMAGVQKTIATKVKIGFFYKVQFMSLSMPNRSPFVDSNQSLQNNRPISSGTLNIQNFIVNSVGVEFIFY